VAELAVAGLDLGDPRAVLLAAMRSPSTSIGYSQFLSDEPAHQVKTVELASTPGGTSSGTLANETSFTVVIPPGRRPGQRSRDSPVLMPGVLRARRARSERDPGHTNLQEG
jgi:hypothetical protein